MDSALTFAGFSEVRSITCIVVADEIATKRLGKVDAKRQNQAEVDSVWVTIEDNVGLHRIFFFFLALGLVPFFRRRLDAKRRQNVAIYSDEAFVEISH